MNRGKDKCEILRAIRRQVAERYGLRYEPRECHHEGDCLGTCPLCDAELKSLQRQLEERGITDIDLPQLCDLNRNFGNESDTKIPMYMDSSTLLPGVPADREELEGMPMPLDDISPLEGEPMPPEEDQIQFLRPPYKHCYIAGLSFHNINDIWEELYEGASLALVRQRDNKYDSNAVAVALAGDYDPEDPDSFDFNFILGYIPRTENEDIAAMMDAGYQFEAEISELNKRASYDKRIEIAIYTLDKEDRKPTTRYRALSIDVDKLAEQHKWLSEKGIMYFRWSSILPLEVSHNLPIKGENVVLMHNRADETLLYLTKVIAVDDDANFFFEDPDEVRLIDNCSPYILSNIAGPIAVPNWSLDFLDKEPIAERQPERFISTAAQSKLEQIFGIK